MKTFYFFITFCIITTQGYSQEDDFIVLKNPQAGILGAPVDEIQKNGDINFDFTIPYEKSPNIENRDGSEQLTEYQNKFRNFVSKYFNSSKISIQNVNASNLVYRYLAGESINKLRIGQKYIYEGLTADSVSITLAAKKSNTTDISKIVKDISSAITNPEATKIIEKVAPFIDSVKYIKNDSIYYDLKIKNPNVYYKVKVVKMMKPKNICNCDWENKCFLYFYQSTDNQKVPQKFELTADFTGMKKNKTTSIYPEFCRSDNKQVRFYIQLEKDKNDKSLHLYIYGKGGTLDDNYERILEVPYQDSDNLRSWRLDRTFLDRFRKGKRIKNVYAEVSAIQKNPNSDIVEIINYRKENNDVNYPLTTLKYPEFRARVVKR